MATSKKLLNIEKNKLDLFNELFGSNHTNNLSIVSDIFYFYSNTGKIKENLESFKYLEKKYEMDCESVTLFFGCQFNDYTDTESTYHLNKCIDTLIVYKVLKMI